VDLKLFFLGKENIFRKEIGIKISRLFDPRVMDRMSRIRDSVIQQEWLTIANKTIPPISAEPQKATLKGNIVVEFSILGIGLCLSIIPFVLEMRKPFCKVYLVIYHWKCNKLKTIVCYLYRLIVLHRALSHTDTIIQWSILNLKEVNEIRKQFATTLINPKKMQLLLKNF